MGMPGFLKGFFTLLFRIVVVAVIMIAIAFGSFEGVNYYLAGSFYNPKDLIADTENIAEMAVSSNQEEESSTTKSENVNAMLHFVESGDSYDDYIAASFWNTKTYAYDLVLIPVNAQVTVGSDTLKEIKEKLPDAVSSVSVSDISQAFGDEKYAILDQVFQGVFGLEFDGYDVMTRENFEKFLTSLGNVTYTFDHTISYRNASAVLKTIESGEQKLTGTQSWAFMTYGDGSSTEESDRLNNESAVLSLYLNKMIASKKNSKIAETYTSLLDEKSKDSGRSREDVLKNLEDDGVTVRILQGSEKDGVFTIDSQKTQLQTSALIQQGEKYAAGSADTSSSESEDTEEDAQGTTSSQYADADSSKDASIELYNAAYVAGLAGDWQTYLEDQGYNISLIDSYQDEGPISRTRIVVAEDDMGEDLLKYFPNAEITTGSISTGGDIRIYIGTDSTDVGETSSDTDDSEEDSDSTYDFSEDENE